MKYLYITVALLVCSINQKINAGGAQALCHLMQAWEKYAENVRKADEARNKRAALFVEWRKTPEYNKAFLRARRIEALCTFSRGLKGGLIVGGVVSGSVAIFASGIRYLFS